MSSIENVKDENAGKLEFVDESTKRNQAQGTMDRQEAANKMKNAFERTHPSPSAGSLVAVEALKRFVKGFGVQEREADLLMQQFRVQQGSEDNVALVCYNAFIDFIFQVERSTADVSSTDDAATDPSAPQIQPEIRRGPSAQKIQKAYRGWRERLKVQRIGINAIAYFETTHAELETSALRIQKAFRGRKARSKVGALRIRASACAFFSNSVKALYAGNLYDLLVLGAGPVGVEAAVACANRGFRVGLIDPKDVVTGAPTGIHSKCLREAALAGASSWPQVKRIEDQVVQRAQEQTAKLLKTYHIELLTGSGSFADASTVLFQPNQGMSKMLTAEHIVIATGSRARRIGRYPWHLPGIFDSDTIGNISYIPKFIVIKGAGIVALEYAMIFSILGSKVIIVQQSQRVVAMLDNDLKEALLQRVEAMDVEFKLGRSVNSVEPGASHSSESPLLLVDTGTEVLECDCFLSAVGRIGVSDCLGLEKLAHLGMKVNKDQHIQVDDHQHTGVENIYAIGDVAGCALATQGQAQAMEVVKRLFKKKKGSSLQPEGQNRSLQKAKTIESSQPMTKEVELQSQTADSVTHGHHLAFGVWTIPEIAWVGITEQQAAANNIDFATARADKKDTMRGIVAGEHCDKGFLKLVFHRRNKKVLGIHICGEHACEMINYGCDLVNSGGTINDILHFIFPSVTYHELYHLAAHKAYMYLKSNVSDSSALHRSATSMSIAAAWNRVSMALHKQGCGEDAIHNAFNAFDVDGSGQLSADELLKTCEMLGIQIDAAEIMQMVAIADEDDDHEISYEEFRRAVGADRKIAKLTKAALKLDAGKAQAAGHTQGPCARASRSPKGLSIDVEKAEKADLEKARGA